MALVPEPKRVGKISSSEGEDYRAFRGVLKYIVKQRSFYGIFLIAACLNYLITYGMAIWMPTYFIRVHGWEASSIGMTIGLVILFPVVVGSIVAGKVTDYFYEKGYRDVSLRFMAFAAPVLLAFLCVFVFAPSINVKITAIGLLYLVGAMYSALSPTVIQMATPPQIRSQVSAILLFVLNLVGLGLGPVSIALVTDYVFQDDMALGYSMVLIGVVAHILSALAYYASLRPFRQQIAAVLDDQTTENRSKFMKQKAG